MLAFQGNLSGGNLSEGELVRGEIVQTGTCPQGHLSEGELVRGEFVRYTYKKMYIPDQTYSPTLPEGRTETLQLTYIPQMLAVYIQYKYTACITGGRALLSCPWWLRLLVAGTLGQSGR